MPQEYTPADISAIALVEFIIKKDPTPVGGVAGIADFLDKPFPFQFPPKVTADSKSSIWEEKPSTSYEPIAIFKGANPRKLAIEAKYIVDALDNNGIWTGDRIAALAQAAKSYFYRAVADTKAGGGGEIRFPIVTIKNLYGSVIRTTSTWRMIDVNISHGDGIVKGSDDGRSIYPLHTKILFNLMSYTKLASEAEPTPKLPVEGLANFPTPRWY